MTEQKALVGVSESIAEEVYQHHYTLNPENKVQEIYETVKDGIKRAIKDEEKKHGVWHAKR